MPKKIKVKVKKKDIRKGSDDCDDCPIVWALKRKGFKNPEVFSDLIYYGKKKKRKTIIVANQKVADFVYNIDNGEKVKPFSFTLKLD